MHPSALKPFVFSVIWLILSFTIACSSTPKRIILLVDDTRHVSDTLAVTVKDFLQEQGITIGENDRVDPPLYAELERSATVTVTRVDIKTETVRLPIPFERQLLRDESYAEGQIRVVQLGANGQVEVTYTTVLENKQETERREASRKIVTDPKPEVLVLGTKGSVAAVPLIGTVVYLSNGNAWVMRNSSNDKRPLTASGDLDGRVFSLSNDGRYLLFSRSAQTASADLNSLWIMDTLILGETPRALPVKDMLYAELSGDNSFLVYSTGEKTQGAPGWKANNDLWYGALAMPELTASPPVSITLKPSRLWEPSQPGPYSWWGANFALAPDGRAIAYALANEVGFSEITGRTVAPGEANVPRRALKSFAPFRTRADWVWVPQVTWSADSRFVLAAVHAPLDSPVVPNDNPLFELWATARDGTVAAALAKQTGMWTRPVSSPPDARGESRIAFGIALSPSDSERSRYALYVMDRDGGNKKQIFPQGQEDGLVVVQVAWAPNARQLTAIRDGDVWLYDFGSARWSTLTANGGTTIVRWGK